jgi:uncharacterized protein DUF885
MHTMRMRARPVLLAFVAATCACGGAGGGASVPPSLDIPVRPPAHPAVRAAAADARTERFASARDAALAELLADDPKAARELGMHEYDGKVAPVSREALAARVARLQAADDALAAFRARDLAEDDALDLAELRSWLQTSLFWLVDAGAPRNTPQFYEDVFALNVYLDRDYAPAGDRARRVVEQEEAALAEAGHIRENLAVPLSRPVAEVASRDFAGFATYLRGDVARFVARAGDATVRARFGRSNEALARASDELAAWLKKEAARGDQSHVLGAQRFAELLRVQEGLTMPLADLAAMNEQNLAANNAAYKELAATVKPEPVKEAEYLDTARRMVAQARAFVIDQAIVTLATDDDATVRETPPYERWNAASIEMSGPFESTRVAYFQLTLPDRGWPARERQDYLGSLGDLLWTTVHEVYPGHFVQGRLLERAPTRVERAFADYAFVEGWAHYTEQMMDEQGFGKDDPANRLAMLHGALLRNCRFAAALAIHVDGAPLEQVVRRFVDDCHQDAATAREQAARGTFDPGYFAYTLGKLQILALREEARSKLGAAFSLRKFHDALLSHGSPPIALVHDRVLRELGAE